MAEFLNREYQRKILTKLAEVYPRSVDLSKVTDGSDNDLIANVHYLCEHELVSVKIAKGMDGEVVMGSASITARGLDFLQDDGGLSAILGTITVKLHDDTIRALLIEKVQKSGADTTAKGKLIETIKGLPADFLKGLAERAMRAGIDHLPEGFDQLQQLLSP